MTPPDHDNSNETNARREPTLADQVYDRLVRDIIDGTYATGARMPSENALAQACKVSRPVLRTALARLRKDGIVATRQGSGNYVARRPEASVASIVPLNSISDIQRCYVFRIGFEPQCAALAAQNRSEEQLEMLSRAIARFNETYLRNDPGIDADIEIHLAIVSATGNPFFQAAYGSVVSEIKFGMNLSRSLTMQGMPQRHALVEAEHNAIFEAIRTMDAEKARAAMVTHLTGARDRMFVGGDM